MQYYRNFFWNKHASMSHTCVDLKSRIAPSLSSAHTMLTKIFGLEESLTYALTPRVGTKLMKGHPNLLDQMYAYHNAKVHARAWVKHVCVCVHMCACVEIYIYIYMCEIIASPLAMITGASIASYPARSHTNNNIDANRC